MRTVRKEIDIECPDGYEPVAFRVTVEGECWLSQLGDVCLPPDRPPPNSASRLAQRLILEPVKKKYDSKTFFSKDDFNDPGFYGRFHPNTIGHCPVSDIPLVVKVHLANGVTKTGLAYQFNWEDHTRTNLVVSWMFVRLADGYEW